MGALQSDITNNNFEINGTLTGRNRFAVAYPTDVAEKSFDVTGFVGINGETLQFWPTAIEDVTPEPPAVFGIKVTPTPAEGQVFTAPVNVTIELLNATGEEAYFDYYLDDVKQKNYPEGGFTLYKTTAVKVVATNDDEDLTEVTWEGTYTINLPDFTIEPSVASGTTLYKATDVTFTPKNGFGDLTIYYQINGGDMQEATETFTVNVAENTTVAITAEDGYRREFNGEFTYTLFVPAKKFKLVTDLTELEAGKQVLIAGVDGDMYVMGAQKKDNRYAVACSLGTALTAPVATLDFTNAKVEYRSMVLGKDKDSDKYTFYDVENEGYLYAASSSNNHLKTETELDDNGKAAIDLVEGKFSVVFQGDKTNKYMQFNSSSTLFSCYGPSNTQEPVYLYVEGEVVEEPIAISVSPEPGTYTEPQTIQFTLTGVPEGETATITYTIGDEQPQTYTEPFKLYKSATITVMAKCGDKSDIQEYTYTINLPALAFEMTPAPGEYDTAQEVTIACTNGIEGCELVYDWTYTPTEGDAITGNQDNPTFTAAKTGVLRIFNVIEDNTDRGDSFDQTYNYTITEPTTTYTITLDKEPGDYTSLVNVKATVEPALPEGATLTFKINDAEPKAYNPEKGVNMLESGTLTFTAKDAQGNELATTSAEYKYIMRVFGDLNGDGTVDVEEVGTVVNLILGKLNN